MSIVFSLTAHACIILYIYVVLDPRTLHTYIAVIMLLYYNRHDYYACSIYNCNNNIELIMTIIFLLIYKSIICIIIIKLIIIMFIQKLSSLD